MKARIQADDINGAWVIMPTPATPNADDWRAENTVDLDETARIVEGLIQAGVDGILSNGTFGECATLTWEEKRAFMATIVEVARGRVPYFCGTTALNTREVVRQTRAAHDMGVSGTMLGVPMWCRMETAGAVQFYQDVAESCPDIAIAVYANPEAFKYDFPRPFWAQVSRIPQVVTAKYLGIGMLDLDLSLAPTIRFLPHEDDYYAAARIAPERMTAFWSSGAMCGPATPLALRDAVTATAHFWEEAAKAKGLVLRLNIEAGVPQLVSVDALRLRQILDNLLSNAIKFTASGSIRLGLAVLAPLSGQRASSCRLAFTVADTGIGIGSQAQARLFRPFVQADHATDRKSTRLNSSH